MSGNDNEGIFRTVKYTVYGIYRKDIGGSQNSYFVVIFYGRCQLKDYENQN